MTTELQPGLPAEGVMVPPRGSACVARLGSQLDAEPARHPGPGTQPDGAPPAAGVPEATGAPTGQYRPSRIARTVVPGTGLLLWAGASVLALARIWTWALACGTPALLVTLGVLASTWLGRRLADVTVHGTSMQPAYFDGDRVLVRRSSTPARGEVVVAEARGCAGEWRSLPLARSAGAPALSSRRWLIKRVAAVPGDPVPRDHVPALANVPEDRVPPGKLVLLGDNEEVSLDSRLMGYFPAERVLGTVLRDLPNPAEPSPSRESRRHRPRRQH